MPYIDIGEIRLPYKVNWSKNRSSFGFAINHAMKLTVRAPLSVSPEEVDLAIEWFVGTLCEGLDYLPRRPDTLKLQGK